MSDSVFAIVALVVVTGGVLFAVQLIAFRILRIVLRFLIAIAAVAAIFVYLQPDTFEVSRTALIAAPPARVFAQVNDFRKWEAWSPWAKLDPQAKTSYEGPAAGQGAVLRWSGNRNVGEGSNTIVESVPDQRIRIRLDFLRPMQGTNDVEFAFLPEGAGTRVTWSMKGKNSFVGKAMTLVLHCDKMVGTQFEQGLADLAAAAGASS